MRDVDDLDAMHAAHSSAASRGRCADTRSSAASQAPVRVPLHMLWTTPVPAESIGRGGPQGDRMGFKDHFSRQSAGYSRYRPEYPPALIEYIAAQAPDRHVAVDCATGSGQAAVALAQHFDLVLAVDGSLSQLAHAQAHPRVHYVASVAERLPLRDRCVALVAAAQAVHWFEFDRFNAECRRVLVPDGVVAVWTYGLFRLAPEVDALIDHFYDEGIGRYWPPERRHVEQAYRTIPFPWREVATPAFALEAEWDLEQVLGYLATWSAVQRCRDDTGKDPLAELAPRLAAAWPGEGAQPLDWPIHLRLGRA
jgi:SAM-dependent methyltransferase